MTESLSVSSVTSDVEEMAERLPGEEKGERTLLGVIGLSCCRGVRGVWKSGCSVVSVFVSAGRLMLTGSEFCEPVVEGAVLMGAVLLGAVLAGAGDGALSFFWAGAVGGTWGGFLAFFFFFFVCLSGFAWSFVWVCVSGFV